ncbi:MAG: succinate dehydrogenase assembly factor 2 [Sphingomicrobium sp.]
MLEDPELKRLHWRAHHRGTREADMLIGGYFDAHCRQWNLLERAQFAEMLDELDVDIMAWALGKAEPPERFAGALIAGLRRLDYIKVAK